MSKKSPLLENENQKSKKCKHCVNFIQFRKEEGIYDCDYNYFNNTPYEDAVLYTPELFDCIRFEDIKDLD